MQTQPTRTTQKQPVAKKPSQQVSVRTASSGAARKTQPVSGRRSVPAKRQELARRHAVRQPRFITVRKQRQERKPLPIGLLLVLVVITVLFLFMMMNYAEIDQYNSQIRDLRNEVASLQAEQKKLDVRLENRDDRSVYETFAVEQLGMVKADSLNKYFVALSPDDKTVIMEYDDGEDSGAGYLLSGLAEVVRDFFAGKKDPS